MYALRWDLDGHAMALLLLIIAGGGATVFTATYLRQYGVQWAVSVCTTAGDICNHSYWMAAIIFGAAILYMIKTEWAS
jgi:hypothetical protein